MTHRQTHYFIGIMTENADGPFQMDEDISGLPNDNAGGESIYNGIGASASTLADNTDTLLRSTLDQLKLHENENEAKTTEDEEEKIYDEDADDKLDINLQKKTTIGV